MLPTLNIIFGAFQNQAGEFTLDNLRNLLQPSILASYWISIRISVASALLGCVIGFFMAVAVVLGGLPRWIRSPLMTFSGVASNFAEVPLAFAFLATLAAGAGDGATAGLAGHQYLSLVSISSASGA
ncbi:MAG: hypothetical protein R3E89_05270 [Thiolinea sp.]